MERKPKYADPLEGFVLRVGSKWALMAQTVDGGYFDGLVAFRLRDAIQITHDESVAAVFAMTLPEWPPSYAPEIDLDTTVGVITGLSGSHGLVGIQKETERRAAWIGTVDVIAGRFVYLHEVRPDGRWHPAPLGYKLRAVTTVEVGRRYHSALSAVAGSKSEDDRGPIRAKTRP
ncbi:hypothetical protein [Microbacterium sp. 2RAF4]|uniref:hypothetical protein n=1 Tax=Microbacterium sp. 2RAF4 TaxID=3232999 RepID=UPI003F96D015